MYFQPLLSWKSCGGAENAQQQLYVLLYVIFPCFFFEHHAKHAFGAVAGQRWVLPSSTQRARARILRNSGRRTAVRAGICAAGGAGGPATRPGPLLDLCHHNRICMLLITQVQWSPSLLDSEVFLFQLAAALNSGESCTLNLFRCGVLWHESTAIKCLAIIMFIVTSQALYWVCQKTPFAPMWGFSTRLAFTMPLLSRPFRNSIAARRASASASQNILPVFMKWWT